MKKIFAIALALVMVLSMASAFASPCAAGPYDWTKTSVTNCGKAKVEIVPYVKVNDGCGGFTWQVSECAAAVASEKVYYAVKLTVDANPDAEWFGKLEGNGVKMTYKGFNDVADTAVGYLTIPATVYAATNTKEAVYYWNGTTWAKVGTGAGEISVADNVEASPATSYIFGNEVKNASKVKVCAALVSKNATFVDGVVGDYKVIVNRDADGVSALHVQDKAGTKTLVTYTVDSKTGNVTGIQFFAANLNDCAPYSQAAIEAFFGLTTTSKITADNVKANFGWDDKVEDCFAWSAKAVGIVDNECVVAIPKTGDKGLLWWLF